MFPLVRADPWLLWGWPVWWDKGDPKRESDLTLNGSCHLAESKHELYNTRMETASYRFAVTRETDLPTIGTLRRWSGGNESALRHLENAYPDWTEITIRKIHETSIKPS